MYVVTGGAGFIGSSTVWMLNQRGIEDILVVDRLGTSEKWKNLVGLRYSDYMEKEQFINALEARAFGSSIEAIIHLGACSSTTERDASYLMENNYRYSVRLGEWWEGHRNCRFIYASSAATYGNGDQGYDDECKLSDLRPLNMYGYSKHAFDLYAQRRGWLDGMVGLKYFNVFGPNEEHKGDMRSVIAKAFERALNHGVISLFKSDRAEYGDGEQKRDFVYVKDAVAMTLSFLDDSRSGIFNIGTGRARSWNDLAAAIFSALDKRTNIEYIEMPGELKNKYQYFTQAKMDKYYSSGSAFSPMTLEEAVRDYVQNYLVKGSTLGW